MSNRNNSISNPFFPDQLSLLIGGADSEEPTMAKQHSEGDGVSSVAIERKSPSRPLSLSQSCHAATNATFTMDHREHSRMARSDIRFYRHRDSASAMNSSKASSSLTSSMFALWSERRQSRPPRMSDSCTGDSRGNLSVIQRLLETPKFRYDLNFDLRAIQNALKSASFLQDSGYRSVTTSQLGGGSDAGEGSSGEHSEQPIQANSNSIPPSSSCRLYGTGWMVADELSDDSCAQEGGSGTLNDDSYWDGLMEVGAQRVRIKDLSEILVSRFAFMSGQTTRDGHPIITFPDSRTQPSFDEFQLLIHYLIKVPVEDQTPSDGALKKHVAVIDRRGDKWPSIRQLFAYLTNTECPIPICAAFLLKPEGPLQRALEVGYRNCTCNENFKVVICQSAFELIHYIGADCLTMDVGGTMRYNHSEWVQHRMEIERMKSSASIIAESLSCFGRCLRETELPNDVETTERILAAQTAERNAIKEDFRISMRKGLSLLRQVRQMEQKPACEQLSPSRLQNVTAIERMLGQLEDTERSFDAFWAKHRHRLIACLKLRRFEETFRKLQSVFAKRMSYLEEHREVGDGVESAEKLTNEHEEYTAVAITEIEMARLLRVEGEELAEVQEQLELSDSLLPKCTELTRMANALELALERRARVLKLSRVMHEQIGRANQWCRKGVELLVKPPSLPLFSHRNSLHAANEAVYEEMQRLDNLLSEGDSLRLDSLKEQTLNGEGGDGTPLLLSTTETSNLLVQVAERIDDIRRLGLARRGVLRQMAASIRAEEFRRSQLQPQGTPPLQTLRRPSRLTDQTDHSNTRSRKPIQVVSPEKVRPEASARRTSSAATTSTSSVSSTSSSNGASPTALRTKSPLRCHSQKVSPTSETPLASISSPGEGPLRPIQQNNRQPQCPAQQQTSTGAGSLKVNYIVEELLATERSYVRELEEVVRFYVKPFEQAEGTNSLPAQLRGQSSESLFGNLRELATFHSTCVLPELERCPQSLDHLCRVLISRRREFLSLYRPYCQQKSQSGKTAVPSSSATSSTSSLGDGAKGADPVDQCAFFVECQKRAGHALPLSAYLLKPVQRITKYQLLLKELLRHSAESDAERPMIQAALASMLDLLAQINAELQQLHILGYPGDLRHLGPLRMQMDCECFRVLKRKTRRRVSNKSQQRQLFLFDGGVLFCKRRTQATSSAPAEYFEYKLCIQMPHLGVTDPSPLAADSFELWDVNRGDGYTIRTSDEKMRAKWLERLPRMLSAARNQQPLPGCEQRPIDAYASPGTTLRHSQPPMLPEKSSTLTATMMPRPQSWTSEDSFKSASSGHSSTSSGPSTLGEGASPPPPTSLITHFSDSNGNIVGCGSPTSTSIASTPVLVGRQAVAAAGMDSVKM